MCYLFRKKDFVGGIVAIISFIWNFLIGFLVEVLSWAQAEGRAGMWDAVGLWAAMAAKNLIMEYT